MRYFNDSENILPEVDMIASGYEWICPGCECYNREIEITKQVI